MSSKQEKLIQEQEDYIQALEHQLTMFNGKLPYRQEEEVNENILYDVTLYIAEDMSKMSKRIGFKGRTESGEVKQIQFNGSSYGSLGSGIKLERLILGLPS